MMIFKAIRGAAQGAALGPAWSLMPLVRRDFGVGVFTPFRIFLFAIFTHLGKWFFLIVGPWLLFTPVTKDANGNPVDPYFFLNLFVPLTLVIMLYAGISSWARDDKENSRSTTYFGRTRWPWLWRRIPFASNGRLLQTYMEPALLFLIGVALYALEPALSVWIQISSVVMFLLTWHHYHVQSNLIKDHEDMAKMVTEAKANTAL